MFHELATTNESNFKKIEKILVPWKYTFPPTGQGLKFPFYILFLHGEIYYLLTIKYSQEDWHIKLLLFIKV